MATTESGSDMGSVASNETSTLNRDSTVTFIFFVIVTTYFYAVAIRLPSIRLSGAPPRKLQLIIPLNLATAPVIVVFLLKASKCIPWTVIADGITGGDSGIQPYNIMILFFSLAYLAMSLGILQSAAFWISNRGGTSGRRLFLYFYFMTTSLSAVLGNDPVILSGTAFLVYFTKVAEVSPVAWLFSEFASCNTASMLLFVGNPTNVVLCEGFKVNYLAFTAYTISPFLATSVAGLIALYIQFWKGHIPSRVTAPQMDPRSVLLDPVGAIVGSVALLVTLTVITGTGFAGVSAWMISLPSAVTKATFDLAWDVLKERQPQASVQQERGAGVEDGIEMHHVNSDGGHVRRLPSKARRRPMRMESSSNTETADEEPLAVPPRTETSEIISLPAYLKEKFDETKFRPYLDTFIAKFPTFSGTIKRLPYALLPFAFSQFILVEALSFAGWIGVFSTWLAKVVGFSIPATVFVVAVLSVILCNVCGTNIGATILLVKILKHPNFAQRAGIPPKLDTAGMLALAVGSNIGAVSFTFSASLAGLLWRGILRQKGITIKAKHFIKWNTLPLLFMTVAGCAITLAVVTISPS